jgi:hypothetical protein
MFEARRNSEPYATSTVVRRLGLVLALSTVLFVVVPGAGTAATDLTKVSFNPPVFLSQDPAFQAAEPSIRVDATDANQRIWVTAPAGILPGSRFKPDSPDSGDFVWYSDDDGKTWNRVPGPGGAGNPTLIGGGDSDVVTGFGQEVYLTGLTLVNVTLAASCNNGANFVSNPISNVGTLEDRQWIDGYEDRPKPALGPEFLLNYGGFVESAMYVHQVAAPCVGGTPAGFPFPEAGPRIDVSGPECTHLPGDENCYQWPGNLAVDENTGDVYITHNTLGDPDNDDVIVA